MKAVGMMMMVALIWKLLDEVEVLKQFTGSWIGHRDRAVDRDGVHGPVYDRIKDDVFHPVDEFAGVRLRVARRAWVGDGRGELTVEP